MARTQPTAVPRSRPARSRAILLFAVGMIAAAVFALVRAWHRAPADPLAALDPARAHAIALDLGRRGHHLAGVPYWRRALAGIATDSWELRRNAAAALNNAAIEVRDVGGRPLPASRSSIERVGMSREALEQVVRAERLAPDPVTRASLLAERGRVLEWWGMGADALVLYHAALEIDPASPARVHAAAGAAGLYGERP